MPQHSHSRPHSDFLKALERQRILPILRLDDSAKCLKLGQLLFDAGFTVIEITLDTPQAATLIQQLNQYGALTGAGTIKSLQDAQTAVAAGAQYLISPGLDPALVHYAQTIQIPYFPGVWTPSEVMQASQLGLKTLKLFPASLGGPDYIKHLRGPFSDIHYLPTGGIGLAEVPAYLKAGALAVGQGTRLVSAAALKNNHWEWIQAELQQLKETLAQV